MNKNIKFKTALDKLEKIVEHLETGEDELEEIVKLFEEGSELILYCNDKLDKVENKIEIISKKIENK